MSLNVNDFQALTYHAKPSVRVYNSVAQTITTATPTELLYNTEVSDRWGMHSTSSNSGRLTVKVPGIYLVQGNVVYDSNATGVRIIFIRHSNSAGTNRSRLTSVRVDASGSTTDLNGSCISLLADFGDFFTMRLFQDSGGNLDTGAAVANNQSLAGFSAMWLSAG